MWDVRRYLERMRLTSSWRSVSEHNARLNFRESDMSSSHQAASEGGSEARPLDRDESRFRYFSPNGKAVIRLGAAPYLTVKTSYERAQEAAAGK